MAENGFARRHLRPVARCSLHGREDQRGCTSAPSGQARASPPPTGLSAGRARGRVPASGRRSCQPVHRADCTLHLADGVPAGRAHGSLGRPRSRLAGTLGGQEAALVDVSSKFSVFRLSGPAAASVLARGCSVELQPPAFLAGCCATTKIERITTLIHYVNEKPSFDVYVGRSFSASLLSWFTDFAESETLRSA